MESRSVTDQQLMTWILEGDPDAAATLVRRYGAALRRVLLHAGARHEDVDDLLQETWIRVIRSAARYDPEQPFSRWLFTVAMNRFRTRAARSARTTGSHEALDAIPPGKNSIPASAHVTLEAEERETAARALVASLPPRLADAVLLRYFEDFSEREIAAAMGIAVGTVKSRLHTAITRLRSDLARRPS